MAIDMEVDDDSMSYSPGRSSGRRTSSRLTAKAKGKSVLRENDNHVDIDIEHQEEDEEDEDEVPNELALKDDEDDDDEDDDDEREAEHLDDEHDDNDTKRTATLHRIRFVDYAPSSILAIALTPPTYNPRNHYPHLPALNSSDANGRELLAVGRQNGEIEVYGWIGGEGVFGVNGGNNKKNRKKEQQLLAQQLLKDDAVTAFNQASTSKSVLQPPVVRPNRQGWVLERRLAPPCPSRVEHLLFTHQTILSEDDYNLCEDIFEVRKELSSLRRTKPRLFTSGGGSDLWEWEWSNTKEGGLGYVKTSISSQGGAIWSIAANESHTTLALGCDDGAIRLVDLWDGALEVTRTLDPTKTRLLSVAWGPQRIIKPRKPQKTQEEDEDADEGADADDMAKDGQAQQQSAAQMPGYTHRHDTYLVTGCADSTVRKWDYKTGRQVARMTTDKLKNEHTLVWSVAVIPGGNATKHFSTAPFEADTLVSGDSMGLVKFWDERTNTQLDSLRCHKSDVLCLTIGPDGRSVYSSGVDQVISECQVVIEKGTTTLRSNRQLDVRRWMHTHSRRLHAHDVRALAISPAYSPQPYKKSGNLMQNLSNRVPVLISGGLDFSLIFTPAATSLTKPNLPNPVSDSVNVAFATSTQRKSPYVPQRTSVVSFARKVGLLAERSAQGLSIWSLQQKQIPQMSSADSPRISDQQPYRKLLDMELKTQTNLVSSAISDDGKWLAASDSYEIRLWSLKTGSNGLPKARRCSSLQVALADNSALKHTEHFGASHLHFTRDSSRLVIGTAPGSQVVVVQLPESRHDDAAILRVFSQHRQRNTFGRAVAGRNGHHTTGNLSSNGAAAAASSDSELEDDDDESSETEDLDTPTPDLACMTTSNDGQWLVSGDMSGRLHVYNLDSLQYHAALPTLELPPVDLAFSPTNPSIVVAAMPNNTIQIFDVDQRTIPSWAQDISRNAFSTFTTIREPFLGLVFDPTPRSGKHMDTLVLYGANFVGTMKLAPRDASREAEVPAKDKRKRDGQSDEVMAETSEEEGTGNRRSARRLNAVVQKSRASIEVTHKYQPLLFFDFTTKGDVVVVEKPYFSLLANMTPAFAAKKYGST